LVSLQDTQGPDRAQWRWGRQKRGRRWAGLGGGPLLALAALLVGAPLAAQERPIIMIDPGHGGPEAGVTVDQLLEKDLVLRLAFTTAAEFVRAGYDVRLTRTGDYPVAGADRRAQAEAAGAALLLSLHMIRSDDPNRHGAEIYFNETIPSSVRGAGVFAQAMEEDGIAVVQMARQGAFLSSPTVPTIMVEAGFLTHPVERRVLVAEPYHRRLAAIFVEATDRFLGR
jgi:N-acetylmuramoyl-L-alanine amidase